MNSYQKAIDIVIAFICMFALPLMYFENRTGMIEQEKAYEAANAFLERAKNSGCISEDLCKNLEGLSYSSHFALSYELELTRPESFVDTGGLFHESSFSWPELSELLERYGRIPLRAGDRLKVKIYRGDYSKKLLISAERSV